MPVVSVYRQCTNKDPQISKNFLNFGRCLKPTGGLGRTAVDLKLSL